MTTPAIFADDVLRIAYAGHDITIAAASIAGNWEALSQRPERRASLTLSELATRVNYFCGFLQSVSSEGGAIDVEAEAASFIARYVSLCRRAWAVDARCASWFVVGSANFPFARNEKRLRWSVAAYERAEAHFQAALKAVERRAWPHGRPDSAIRMSNPDAPALIRAKIEQQRHEHTVMKAANAIIRKNKSVDSEAVADAIATTCGMPIALAKRIMQPKFGRPGFAAFELSGALAEIKRLEQRLAQIEAMHKRGTVSETIQTDAGPVDLIENAELARIQLVFQGKPGDAVRTALKTNGFRWSPRAGAWQRHLNNAGRCAARRVLTALGHAAPTQAEPTRDDGCIVVNGRRYAVTALFEDDDSANHYLAGHPGEGVILTRFGKIYIARIDDKGSPA